MQPILAPSHVEVLRQLAAAKVLLAFDFDGTLAPTVDEPGAAALRRDTRLLLDEVSRRYPCVVISGRSRADLLRRLRGVALAEVLGNHGLEPSRQSEVFIRQVSGWLPVLTARLAREPGVGIENKLYSVALHYRRAPNRQRAREAILEAVRLLKNVRHFPGRLVVNVVADGAPHKGLALAAARARLGCDTALYVGDDETDEEVFAVDQPGQLLGICVGEQPARSAPFFIPDQLAIDELLRQLIEARSADAAQRGHRRSGI